MLMNDLYINGLKKSQQGLGCSLIGLSFIQLAELEIMIIPLSS